MPALAGLVIALVLANFLLTYENAWPTPWAHPSLLLSAELAVIVILVGLLSRAGRLWVPVRVLLAIALAALFLVHYADVTTEGLYGKPIDVYWDLAHLPNATAMLAGNSPALFVGVLLGSTVVLGGFLGLAWWVVGAIAGPTRSTKWRVGLTAAAGLVVVAATSGMPGFARPASLMIAQQARLLATNLSVPPVELARDLEPLRSPGGADVYVLFFESYAGQVFTDPDLTNRVSPAHSRLDDALARSGWHAASTMVIAPTFGGASWLAHASLLSGRTIDNQRDHNEFLAAPSPTLIDRFGEAGYRTVALMPGLIDPWPEGESLGFDAVYSRRNIDYGGPGFGFWHIPDQASLAWLARTEMAVPDRSPLFVLFPTVMSHIPFGPVPPYQAEWSRFGNPNSYETRPVVKNGASVRMDFDYRTPYVAAVHYNLDVLGGFLQNMVPEDAVLVALGDHPPPAIVVGPKTPWLVPVHVFARDPRRLGPFLEAGFDSGLRPSPLPIGEMARLTPLLLAMNLERGAHF